MNVCWVTGWLADTVSCGWWRCSGAAAQRPWGPRKHEEESQEQWPPEGGEGICQAKHGEGPGDVGCKKGPWARLRSWRLSDVFWVDFKHKWGWTSSHIPDGSCDCLNSSDTGQEAQAWFSSMFPVRMQAQLADCPLIWLISREHAAWSERPLPESLRRWQEDRECLMLSGIPSVWYSKDCSYCSHFGDDNPGQEEPCS